MWQWAGRALILAGTVVVCLSFAGRWYPLGDSLAVFRPVFAAGLCLICLFGWRWTVAWVSGALAVFVLVDHGLGFSPTGHRSSDDITVYQKNMLFLPRDRGPLIEDIRQVNAQFVTLQEVSRANVPMLEALRDVYPYQLLCNGHAVGAVAVLSQTPLEQTSCGSGAGFARAVTSVQVVPVQVYAVHLHWPWPFGQATHVEAMLKDFSASEDGLTIVGGDFNMVATGHSLAQIAQVTGTRRVGQLIETYRLFDVYPLAIDHVLATGGRGSVEQRPKLGADHYGVVARVSLN